MSASSYLFVFNEAPYGNERVYNGLRLAGSLARREGLSVKVFAPEELVEGSRRGTMDELAEWVATSDQVLIF